MSAVYPMTEPFDPDDYLKWSLEQERLANEKELTIEDLIPTAALEPAPNEVESSAPQPESVPKSMTDDELAELGPEFYALTTCVTDEEMLRQIARCCREDVPTWRKFRIEAEQQMFLKNWVASPNVAKN